MHIDPTQEQIAAFSAGADDPAPVFMLNLLRFKERADAPDDDVSGAEAYMRYSAIAGEHLARVGGQIVWAGGCHDALIGPGEREWDVVAVVRYPSRGKFLEMVADPDYLAGTVHRTASLAESRLIPCTEAPLG